MSLAWGAQEASAQEMDAAQAARLRQLQRSDDEEDPNDTLKSFLEGQSDDEHELEEPAQDGEPDSVSDSEAGAQRPPPLPPMDVFCKPRYRNPPCSPANRDGENSVSRTDTDTGSGSDSNSDSDADADAVSVCESYGQVADALDQITEELRQMPKTPQANADAEDTPGAAGAGTGTSTHLQHVYARYRTLPNHGELDPSLTQDARLFSEAHRTGLQDQCLVMGGASFYSLVHHLGVVLYLVESGRLSRVRHIWAEEWAVPLAVLLKVHWDVLTRRSVVSGGYPPAERLHKLLLEPVLMLAFHGSRLREDLLARYFDFASPTGEPLKWWSRETGVTSPDLHLCLSALPGDMDYTTAKISKRPQMLYYNLDSYANTGRQMVTCLQDMYNEKDTLVNYKGTGHGVRAVIEDAMVVGQTRYSTMWSALADTLGDMHRELDGFTVQMCLSHGGMQRIAPIQKCDTVCVDPSDMHSPWEFCCFCASVVLRGALNAVDVRIYSPYTGDYHYVVRGVSVNSNASHESQVQDVETRVKQVVCQHMTLPGDQPVQDLSLMQTTLNWGYAVAHTMESAVAESLGCLEEDEKRHGVHRNCAIQLPRILHTSQGSKGEAGLSPVESVRARRKEQTTGLFSHEQAQYTSARARVVEPLAFSASGTKAAQSTAGFQQAKRTPCKWVLNLFKSDKSKDCIKKNKSSAKE